MAVEEKRMCRFRWKTRQLLKELKFQVRLVACLVGPVFLFYAGSSASQVTESDEVYGSCSVEELASISRIWGFLKYHHPGLRGGDVDADDVFLEALSNVCRESLVTISEYFEGFIRRNNESHYVGSHSQLDRFLSSGRDVYRSYGNDHNKNMPPDWIYNDTNVNPSVRRNLLDVFHYSRKTHSHYNNIWGAGSMSNFQNEKPYPDDELNVELRLLSLFRIWNAIEYYYPFKGSVSGGWDKAQKTAIPDFILSDDPVSYRKSIRRLLAKTEDGHAGIYEDKMGINRYVFGSKVPLFVVTHVDNEFIVKSVFEEESDILIGDSIKEIEGEPVEKIASDIRRYISSANDRHKNQSVAQYLAVSNKDKINVRVDRGRKDLGFRVKTVGFDEFNKRYGRNSDKVRQSIFHQGDTRYVHIDDFYESVPEDLFDGYENTIVDLRGYPKDGVIWEFVDDVVDESKTFAKIAFPSPVWPGIFDYEESISNTSKVDRRFDGNLYILVDHRTMSQSEYIVMALSKADYSTVVGCQTAGADGDVVTLPLPGGVSVGFTGLEVKYPDGTPTQKVGVDIDVGVCENRESVEFGEDAILNKALDVIGGSR